MRKNHFWNFFVIEFFFVTICVFAFFYVLFERASFYVKRGVVIDVILGVTECVRLWKLLASCVSINFG